MKVKFNMNEFQHETPSRLHRAVDSLFIIAGHGALIQYDLDPHHVSSKYLIFSSLLFFPY